MKLRSYQETTTRRLSVACSLLAAITASAAPAAAQSSGASGTLTFSSEGASASGSTTGSSTGGSGELPYMKRYVPEANLWELGLFGGVFFPSDSHELLEPGRRQRPFETAGEIGARVAYYPLSFLGVELEGAAMPSGVEGGSSGGLLAGRGHLIGQLPNWSITPFALIGMGALSGGSTAMGTDADPAVHFGVGAKAALDEYLSVRLDVRDTLSQKFDASNGTQTHHPEVLFGLSFTLERTQPDSDGDGRADHRDRCPHVAGPDDGCPPAAEPAPEPAPPPPPKEDCACSDRDGDGLTDEKDQCPDTPAPTANGCPSTDADGDGIDDAADRCPTEPETRNGFQDADGCPDEVPAEVKRFSGVIRGIEFDYNSAVIQPGSRALLDDAAKVLTQYPELKVEISGHSDSQGPRDHNLDLSRRRAESVKTYLVGRGVDPARLTTRGAGPDEPIADNGTVEGRKQNRRIEFKVVDR